jgi:hypothetical protein
MLSAFGEDRDANLWDRFAESLSLLAAARQLKTDTAAPSGDENDLVDLLRGGQDLPGTPELPAICAYPNPIGSPWPSRVLFAATLYPDTVPADTLGSLGLFKRLAMVPKLMALCTLAGVYASRILGRNVAIDKVVAHPVQEDLDDGATQLLLRYFRSRLWQRHLTGGRLDVISGLHQHIQDLNAIVFLARAEAERLESDRLTETIVRTALSGVEFHLANQTRLYDQTMKQWFRSQLQDPGLAFTSLRLMALKPADETVAVESAS